MKYFWLILICTGISACQNTYQFQEGDLFFQDLDSSPLCDAIELVTPGHQGSAFSHIGMLVKINGDWRILEALPPKVLTTSVDSFLSRSFDTDGNPKVIVGRLEYLNKTQKQEVCQYAIKQIGMPYDDSFLIDNERYYCSELIQEAYSKIDSQLFPLEPMTFLNPVDKDTLDIWEKYYKALNTSIPEGELGINPGLMSISLNIKIVHLYGNPDGYQAQ